MLIDTKYNYIIAGGGGFYSVAYADVMNLPNVAYFDSYVGGIHSRLANLLIRLNFNIVINKHVSTPLRWYAFPRIFHHYFKDSKPLCFIFFGNQFAVINTSYLEYLRKHYPDIKLVLYMQDIVASLPYYDIENYKRRFDIVLSYDQGDCRRYNLEYYPTPFSNIPEDSLPKQEPVDFYFCGAGKNRYEAIIDIYRRCVSEGMTCRFFITGVPKDKQIEGEGLIYDHPINYKENLSHVVACKCVVEIMQANADGYTPRLWEAITYGKHLLTNNISVEDSVYYNCEYIHRIDCKTSLKSLINKKVFVDEDVKKSMSPVNLINKIESMIC